MPVTGTRLSPWSAQTSSGSNGKRPSYRKTLHSANGQHASTISRAGSVADSVLPVESRTSSPTGSVKTIPSVRTSTRERGPLGPSTTRAVCSYGGWACAGEQRSSCIAARQRRQRLARHAALAPLMSAAHKLPAGAFQPCALARFMRLFGDAPLLLGPYSLAGEHLAVAVFGAKRDDRAWLHGAHTRQTSGVAAVLHRRDLNLDWLVLCFLEHQGNGAVARG